MGVHEPQVGGGIEGEGKVKGWVLLMLVWSQAYLQSAYPKGSHLAFADSLRKVHGIPGIGYAIVSADEVLEMEVVGECKAGSGLQVSMESTWRIGSNTKAITGMLAAWLVAKGEIRWNSRWNAYYPSWVADADPGYSKLDLEDLLSFRTRLPKWTYSFPDPKPEQIQGDAMAQRLAFAAWSLRQAPTAGKGLQPSNLGYVVAGAMLEAATGASLEKLYGMLGAELGIAFAFGSPQLHDPLDTWGHDSLGHAEQGSPGPQLEWLTAAGNIRMRLPDYARFLQVQLLGLEGRHPILPKKTFEFLHYGRKEFAVGWYWGKDALGRRYSHNLGNPGGYVSRVLVVPDANRAYVVFANAMGPEAYAGTASLLKGLQM